MLACFRFVSAAMTGIALLGSSAQADTGTITGRVAAADGRPLPYANVVLAGSHGGAQADGKGEFVIHVAPGVYSVKAMMMGFRAETRAGVRVDAGMTATVNFRLVVEMLQVQEILIVADPPMVDTDETDVVHGVTGKDLEDMPLDGPIAALAMKPGIVQMGDELFVRGSRPDETLVQINGMPVRNPLQSGTVEVGVLGTERSDVTTGGMDPEYGDAQAAVINIATREGGDRFRGEVRYFTDDFGRSDKTYTNLDRIGIGFGGPTWWRRLTYYVAGEGVWSDTENASNEPRQEHKLTDFLKFRERQSAAYNLQSKLAFTADRGMKVDAEAIYSTSREDEYHHNWNVSGYVGKVWQFQELNHAVTPAPGEIEVMEFGRVRVFDHGPWAEIKDDATRARRLNIRPVIVESPEPRPDGTTEIVTYTNFRAADLREGNRVVTVVWDEAVRSADGTVLSYRSWALFEGYQRQLSQFKPVLQDAAGADSSFVPFNSATHTPETRSDNLQLQVGFRHLISKQLSYSVQVSRLDLHRTSTVLDENGDPKSPAEFSTAGLPVTLPNGTLLTSGVSTATWYTDDDVPYLVTAYDYPFYSDQRTLQWLWRGDVTWEGFKGHRLKTGGMMIYNDLNNDERAYPGQQRVNPGGRVQQGLDVNLYRSFNSEGAVYAQDKWEYEGMVVNGGFRFDWLTVGNNDEILIANSEIDPRVETFKSSISPRLGIAFPITDRDKFFFHYGRFTQWPGRVYLFNSQNFVGTTGTLGNPNLQPQLTVSYQAGISHQFSDDIAANFVMFNKDIYGLISSAAVTDDSTGIQALRYVNRSYASSRGIELSLEKRLTRRLGFEVYYTYSFADGVASDADFGRSAAGLTHLPTGELPLDWDQRHLFNATVRLQDAQHWGATLVYAYGSGVPWTPVDRFARLQDPALENSRRLEPTHRLSLQGRKQFNVYGSELTLFVEGRNLLDDDILFRGGTAPNAFPTLEAANMDGGSYLTETGRYGGAYLRDTDDDGQNEFFALNDPTIWDSHRQWRLGVGFEF